MACPLQLKCLKFSFGGDIALDVRDLDNNALR